MRVFAEQTHAEALYRDLGARFGADPAVAVAVTGVGVHWSCTATRGPDSCEAYCSNHGGAQYIMTFRRGGEQLAEGRTRSGAEAIDAAGDWLAGHSVGAMHARFAFIDRRRRELTALRDELHARSPELAVTPGEVRDHGAGFYRLHFAAADRACEIKYYGEDEFPGVSFSWDECGLFDFTADDPARLAEVLVAWVTDRAMPSEMRAGFPWLNISPVADYYERGNPVEGEFLDSWDGIEGFYRDFVTRYPDSWGELATAVLGLVADLRARGYDKRLRAGQSMISLIVSRSRRHGLRSGQPCVAFEFPEGGMTVTSHALGVRGAGVRLPTVALTPAVEALLDRLAEVAVD